MRILSIIIPCYNEAKTIGSIIERVLLLSIPGWQTETIVIENGSEDNTKEILKNYEAHLKIIYHPQNRGKGGAVKTGLANAIGDYIIIQDADLEYNPAEIPSLVQALEQGAGDIIYGSRNLNRFTRKGPLIPRLGTWLTTKEFNLLYGAKLTDIWTCYKLFPKAASQFFVTDGFETDLIFSARTAKAGYRLAEVPISHQPRTIAEGKKIRYRDGLNGLLILLREYFK